MRTGLQARIGDPLWMLGRQWQFGEFQGSDEGSPVQARLRAEAGPVSWYLPGQADPGPHETGQELRGPIPLETLVERESRVLSGSPDLRLRAEAGLHFLRLLGPLAGAYSGGYLKAYPLPTLSDDERIHLDGDALRCLDVLAGRAPDGGQLFDALHTAVSTGKLPASPAIAAADQAKVLKAAEEWLKYYGELFSQPEAGSDEAWAAERLEYQFSLSAPGTDKEIVLTAPHYPGGHLDWYSFSVQAGASLAPSGGAATSAPQKIVRTVIPAPVRYPGMPANRWWEFEDARVDFGAIDVARDDLARMVMVEYALIYGNDHFVIPIDLEAGSVCRVQSLVVTDTFGYRVLIPSARDTGPQWRMFHLSANAAAGGATPSQVDEIFFLPPVLATTLESDPVEDVQFLGDEMANLAWAIERRVEGAAGRPVNRAELYREQERRRAAQGPGPITAHLSPLTYRLATSVPDYWIPLVPGRAGLAWWPGEGNADDAWGTNNGTVQGGVSYAPGRVGRAFSFDGATGFIQVPHAPALDVATYTIEGWIYWKGGGKTWQTILSKGPIAEQYALLVQRDRRCVQHVLTVGGSRLFFDTPDVGETPGGSLQSDTWVHVAATFDGQKVKIYIDGQVQVEEPLPAAGTPTSNGRELRIGARENDADAYFNGLVDELALYSRALSDREIEELYRSGGADKLQTRLLRGAMLDVDSGVLKLDQPQGRILEADQQLVLHGEEVPREGVGVTRSFRYSRGSDGSTYLWMGRRRGPGQGEGSSGLRFDFVDKSETFAGAGVRPPAGLVAWWPGDGDARDIWGGCDGTLVNGATFDAGMVGQAFRFDGQDDYVEVPHTPPLAIAGNQITIEAWVNPSRGSPGQPGYGRSDVAQIVSKDAGSNPSDRAFNLGVNMQSGGLHFEVRTTDRLVDVEYGAVAFEQFSHVASTYDGTTMRWYINGRLVGSQPQSGNIVPNNSPLLIGRFAGGAAGPFQGLIDELSVYNRALSAAEIAGIYSAGSSGKFKAGVEASGCFPPPAGLIHWWPGDSAPGDVQGGAHGTPQGGVSYAPGMAGQAFRFDGSGYVQASAAGLPAGAADRTLELWVRLDRTAGGKVFVAGYGQPGVAGAFYGLYLDGKELRFQPFGTSVPTGVSLEPGAWYHLAVTNTASLVSIYVDGGRIGDPQNVTFSTPVPPGSQFYIGGQPAGASTLLGFPGLIDEVSLYNRALSPDELGAIYRAGSAGKCRP